MANFIRNVVVDGVTYAVGDKRIEGDNFAYIQIPEAVTIGTNLTDLAPIQKALDSTDGAMLYVPSLNALFSPTASTSPTVRIWSSTVGDKGYQLKATLNASGVLQSAVVNEASAEAGLIITDAEWTPVLQQYLGKDPADFDPTGTYLITDEAKAIANKLATVDAEVGAIKVIDKFQIEFKNLITESMANCIFNGTSLDYINMAFDVMFKIFGNILSFGPSGPQTISLDAIGPVVDGDSKDIVGLIITEGESSFAPNIFTDDYLDIESNTSQLEPSEPYDDSPIAKEIGQMLIDHFYNFDGDTFDWDSDHFTVSQKETSFANRAPDVALSFYTLGNININIEGTLYLKFTTTAEWYNGDIFVFVDDDYKTCLGMRIDPKPEDCVKVAKKYMEIEVDTPENILKANVAGDTLNLFSVQPSTTSNIIHYPESMLFTSDSPFELKFVRNFSTPTSPNFETSKDGHIWNSAVPTAGGFSFKADELNPELGKYSVFIKGDDYFNQDVNNRFTFSTVSGSNIEVSGILDAMWGGKEPNGSDASGMFELMTQLVSAKNLIFPNKASEHMCSGMFYKCTSLTQAPSTLPATTLAELCYFEMFGGCTSLTTAPSLPATTLADYCYKIMFRDCTSLVIPPHLPAITLAGHCYEEMFYKCTSLIKAPEISAINLATECCRNMFMHCTALTHASSVLPATTLAESCYDNMFTECTSLIQAPELPATTLAGYCYSGMFTGCTSLTQAPVLPATTLAESCYGVMFKDCTSLVKAPELPATTSEYYCYSGMFDGCEALTQAPELPATVMEEDCYFEMFKGCKSLTKPVVFPEITTMAPECMEDMFKGCEGIKWAASGTPYEIKTTDGSTVQTYTTGMFAGNGGSPLPESSGTPKLNTTYYLEA